MQKFVAALLAGSVVSAVTGAPGWAQYSESSSGSRIVRKDRLDKVTPFMARPQIEILDESPIVKDRRPVPEDTSYEVVIPPLPRGNTGAGGGGAAVGPPGPRVIRLTPSSPGGRILAQPGFQSNIGSLKAPQAPLPAGHAIGVHAQMDKPVTAGRSGAMKGSPRPLVNANTPAATATYTGFPPRSVSTSDSQRTSLGVKAERMKPGALLNK